MAQNKTANNDALLFLQTVVSQETCDSFRGGIDIRRHSSLVTKFRSSYVLISNLAI